MVRPIEGLFTWCLIRVHCPPSRCGARSENVLPTSPACARHGEKVWRPEVGPPPARAGLRTPGSGHAPPVDGSTERRKSGVCSGSHVTSNGSDQAPRPKQVCRTAGTHSCAQPRGNKPSLFLTLRNSVSALCAGGNGNTGARPQGCQQVPLQSSSVALSLR